MVRVKNFRNGFKGFKNAKTKHVPYLAYNEAKKLLKQPYLTEIVENKHITLGWQHSSNIKTVIKNYVKNLIGSYIQSIQAIPISIKKIVIKRPIFIIEDHDCMHFDVSVHMIAFSVCKEISKPKPLKCKAVFVNNKTVIGQLYNIITVKNRTTIPNLKKGDNFEAYFDGIQFNGNLVQILTRLNKLKKLS